MCTYLDTPPTPQVLVIVVAGFPHTIVWHITIINNYTNKKFWNTAICPHFEYGQTGFLKWAMLLPLQHFHKKKGEFLWENIVCPLKRNFSKKIFSLSPHNRFLVPPLYINLLAVRLDLNSLWHSI